MCVRATPAVPYLSSYSKSKGSGKKRTPTKPQSQPLSLFTPYFPPSAPSPVGGEGRPYSVVGPFLLVPSHGAALATRTLARAAVPRDSAMRAWEGVAWKGGEGSNPEASMIKA
jgi:hypothetical protein